MEIKKTSKFSKNYRKRILGNTSLENRYRERVSMFIYDRTDSILKDHKLLGKEEGVRSFSLTGDIRILYILVSENLALFMDIGSHNQVYS